MDSTLIREATLKGGQRVSWTLERGNYTGAQPYHAIVRYVGARHQLARYTPSEQRAEALFRAMCQGIQDPELLAKA
jgi:hypothetical protein